MGKIISDKGGVDTILEAMKTHKDEASMQERACIALYEMDWVVNGSSKYSFTRVNFEQESFFSGWMMLLE